MSLSGIIKSFARKVLDVDDTHLPREQYAFFTDCTKRLKHDPNAKDIKALLYWLLEKHFIESITVATKNGSLLVSSNGNGAKEAMQGTALFNYINKEVTKSEVVFLKSGSWQMMIPFRDKVYIIKAAADLSQTELQHIAKEVEDFLQEREAF
jgi:hypothetical protein